MKFNNSDLRFALDQAAHYRQLGDDATAAYWTKRADEIANWLQAKKDRAARRRAIKKLTPAPKPATVSPVSLPAEKLDWVAAPTASLVAFTNMVLAAEGASNCQVKVAGHKVSSYFRPGANIINFSHTSIDWLLKYSFSEYKTVRWVWQGMANTAGEVALKMLALHEAAHAIDYARHGYCHHHQRTYQHILRELAIKYATPAFVSQPAIAYA